MVQPDILHPRDKALVATSLSHNQIDYYSEHLTGYIQRLEDRVSPTWAYKITGPLGPFNQHKPNTFNSKLIRNGLPNWVKISFIFHLLQSLAPLFFFFFFFERGVGGGGGEVAENLLWQHGRQTKRTKNIFLCYNQTISQFCWQRTLHFS